ncbi:hypothetical protein SAMN02745157_4861 [Kaistia soli DSM 19436]|uniref:Uncharacterized protein n=1 Tax=Kaistia soli DSM 19436 TaxID=1122133 RepID=A0A1M5MR35_9HYPH|nr:hypothetical protein [Kaistia soli]SHG79854.1 hypothetical protein SAMN02745157_4861 [Kaistia soli DSM 19436]
MWSDVEAFRAIGAPDGVIASNDIGVAWDGPLAAWVTLHKDKMPGWLAARTKAERPQPDQIVFHEDGAGQDGLWRVEPSMVVWHMWPEMTFSGSSGLFGVKVALEMGFDKIVLCGVPMNAEPHFHDSDSAPWADHERYAVAWHEVLPRLGGKVTSMGGLTRELLGAPTTEWLNG